MMFQEFLRRKAEIIKKTDPDRIYVENIRSFFNIPYSVAKFLCDTAVRQGLFEKKIAIECTNNNCKRIIKTFAYNDELPEEITCIVCEAENRNKSTFNNMEYKIVEYYKLLKR